MPHALILYHYFHPDDVVSARHFDGLSRGLVDRGWRVTAMPCNRGCRDESLLYSARETWHGVAIRRVWRPAFRQASTFGRMANAIWMIAAWSVVAFRRGPSRPDVVIIGTDPVLSVLSAWAFRWTRPATRVAHWAFDLYPEAPIAEGMLRPNSLPVRVIKWLMGGAYRRCELIADLGSCMRRLLAQYRPKGKAVTLVPWALSEPAKPVSPDTATRHELFGDAKLALLYSGNFGRAHSYAELLELARALKSDPVSVCFAVRGNRSDELKNAVGPEDVNIRLAGFAAESELEKRLGAADVHLVSLRPEWTGVVVPSKFFGSMASGRPVVFAGSRESALAKWIEEHGVGWVLTADSVADVAADLRELSNDPARLTAMQQRCHDVYHRRFSYQQVMNGWDMELRALLPRKKLGLGNIR